MAKDVESLKEKLREVRGQRDRLRQTRDMLRAKLSAAQRMLGCLGDDHLDLWQAHVLPQFDSAVPDERIVEHIAYRRDAGHSSGTRLLREGWIGARQIGILAESVLGPQPRFNSVLDFGCGCARVTRYLTKFVAPGGSLMGCDIDASAVEWNQANLPHSGTFFTSADHPPLPLPVERQFDLIVVISVFTHLPEAMQDRWMEELVRRLTPDGIMIATFHGDYFKRFVPAELQAEFTRSGFCYTDLGKTPDLPDYYLTAFHTHEYITRHWGQFGEIVRIEPMSVGHQDAAVVRKHKK
ncbi:MAG: class I SAM-dependent methyltransferase [Verrucomicrobiales bacterium]|nr:class I SAM-dependent methyltransferase [Verrucomicrobiales bacterium]